MTSTGTRGLPLGIRLLVVALAYFGGASLGIELTREAGNVAAFWPPNAILLAVLLRGRVGNWAAYITVCIAANMAANFVYGDPIIVAAGLAAVNMLEVAGGAMLVHRTCGTPFTFDGIRPLIVFTLVVAGVACALAALLGAGLVHVAYGAPYWTVWKVWFVADAIGILLITPLLLSITPSEVTHYRFLNGIGELVLIVILMILASVAVFDQGNFVYLTLIIPVSLWAAIRLKVVGASICAVILAVIGTLFTIHDAGPFVSLHSISQQIQNLQIYLIGTLMPILGIAVAVSERKQAEEALHDELRRRSNQLEQALAKEKELNELQRQFVSMVSHEFRTPLAIIDGAAQRMMRRVDRLTPDDIQQRTRRIRSAVKRMTVLIESTLSLARLDAGQFEMNPRYIDAGEVVAENCRVQQEISASDDLSVDVGGITAPIFADPGLLNHILTNLLSNAVKYSPDGGKIEVRGWMEDEQVLVSIRDYGVGITDNDLRRLFERFFRAGTSTGIAGSGIGLHLVKQLLELHGGSIEVESVEGEGSTFTIRLPIKPAEDVIARGPVGPASPAHITAAE